MANHQITIQCPEPSNPIARINKRGDKGEKGEVDGGRFSHMYREHTYTIQATHTISGTC